MVDLSPLSVTQLNHQIRWLLEDEVGEVAVTGEISNLMQPRSKHCYFSLKDDTAQLRCVFFYNYHPLDLSLENGQQVILTGKLSLYEARGDYQLIVYKLNKAGLGNLYLQFEQLKQKLASLGFFAAEHKKLLPIFPKTIGVITSASGAALKDILITLKRRFPLAFVSIYPSEVQGKEAPFQLIQGIQTLNELDRCQVIILARGGGSLEDLWAFNDESLAAAIFHSTIPIVTGIGHETDFTIADFVSDLRAATPTAAAEAVTPHIKDLQALLANSNHRLLQSVTRIIKRYQLFLNHQITLLHKPKHALAFYWQTLDYLEKRLLHSVNQGLKIKSHGLYKNIHRLKINNPQYLFQQKKLLLTYVTRKLVQAIAHCLSQPKQRLTRGSLLLKTLNPLSTLERGYAIALSNSHVLLDSRQTKKGDKVKIRLAKGNLECQVIRTVFDD